MGPRAGLDGRGNSPPPPGFDSRTVQPVASCYTDCAFLALRARRRQENSIELDLGEHDHKNASCMADFKSCVADAIAVHLFITDIITETNSITGVARTKQQCFGAI